MEQKYPNYISLMPLTAWIVHNDTNTRNPKTMIMSEVISKNSAMITSDSIFRFHQPAFYG